MADPVPTFEQFQAEINGTPPEPILASPTNIMALVPQTANVVNQVAVATTPAESSENEMKARDLRNRIMALPATDAFRKQWEGELAANPKSLEDPHAQRAAEFILANKQPGQTIQLTGPGAFGGNVSPWIRFRTEARRNVGDQLRYLQNEFGEGNARIAADGHSLIVSVPRPNGTKRDVTLNEDQMTLGDVAALAGHWDELAGGLLGTIIGGKIGGLKTLGRAMTAARDVAFGSAGMELGGAVGDVGTSLLDAKAPPMGEILTDRAKNIPADLILGAGMVAGAKGYSMAKNLAMSPFSFARTAIQEKALAGAEDIAKQTGIQLLLDPGEATGFRALIAARAYASAHPAGGSAFAQFRDLAETRIKSFQGLLAGNVGPDEEVAQQILDHLQARRATLEGQLGSAQEAAVKGAQRQIETGTTLGLGAPVEPITAAGEKVRSAVNAEIAARTQTKNELFSEVYSIPGANRAAISTKPISDELDAIKADLPKQGKPGEVLANFVPPEVKRFLDTPLDPKMGLRQLVEMRDLLWDRYIPSGDAAGSIPERYLKRISGSITQAIREGVDAMADWYPNWQELKTRLATANDYFENTFLKVKEPGIGDLARATTDPGFMESQDIISRLKQDPSKYARTMGFFGANAPAAASLRQAIHDDILSKSKADLQGTMINGKALLQQLRDLRSNPRTREIYNDAFKNTESLLTSRGALAGAAQGDIPIDEARKLLAHDKPSVAMLNDIADKQKALNDAMSNEIMQKWTKGEFEPRTLNSERFVDTVAENFKTSDLKGIMDYVRNSDPAAAEDFSRKMIQKTLMKAAATGKPGESLGKILDDPEQLGKLKAVIGDQPADLLRSYSDYEKAREFAKGYARGTGMFKKGGVMGEFFNSMPGVAELQDIAKYRIVSTILAMPAAARWLTLSKTPEQMRNLAKAFIVSGPFIRAALNDDPNDKSAYRYVHGAARAAGISQPQNENAPSTQDEAGFREFQKQINTP